MPSEDDEVTCIKRELGKHHPEFRKGGQTWCGKDLAGFTFTSLDHAAENGLNEGRLVACSACVAKAIKGLEHGLYSKGCGIRAHHDDCDCEGAGGDR